MAGYVKIRHREVVAQQPAYGRFPEYQVVKSRKVLSRHDLRGQAESWCEKHGYEWIVPNSKKRTT